MKHEGVLYERPESTNDPTPLPAMTIFDCWKRASFFNRVVSLKVSLSENNWMPLGIGQEATHQIFSEASEEFTADRFMKGLRQDNQFS